MIDNKLYEYMAELLKRTPLDFIRYKYDEINRKMILRGCAILER